MCPQRCEQCKASPPAPEPFPIGDSCAYCEHGAETGGCTSQLAASETLEVLEPVVTWKVDPQSNSPLFAKIPTEIRLQIFGYALTPWTFLHRGTRMYGRGLHRTRPTGPQWDEHSNLEPSRFDFRVRADHDGDRDDDLAGYLDTLPDILPDTPCGSRHYSWCRPDCRGRPVLTITLLQTCRRAFIEARSLVFKSPRSYWPNYHTQPGHPVPELRHGFEYGPCPGDELAWGDRRPAWEQRFKDIWFYGGPHLLFKLWDRGLELFEDVESITCFYSAWDSVKVHDTLGRSKSEDRPLINPYARGCTASSGQHHLEVDMGLTTNFDLSEALTRDSSLPHGRPGWLPPGVFFRDWAWGKSFVTCTRLRTFTLVIDALEEFKDAMEQHVQWASRTWQLPLDPDNTTGYQYLSADGNPIQRTSWRGPNIYWRKHCVECNVEIRLPNSECEEHTRIETLFRKGLGPQIYTWTITFTARTYSKRWSPRACYMRNGPAPPQSFA